MEIVADNYRFRRHEVAYLAARPWIRGATVLEAGAGEGYGADILSRVARRVIAVDPDAAACEYAAKAYPGLTVTRANLTELPIADGSVEAVVSLQTVHRLADRPGFVAECARVLRSAGTLVVSTPNSGEVDLPDLLAPHFRVDRLYGVHPRRRLRRRNPATVSHRDFHFAENTTDDALDLFAIAIRI
ncbi:class I SAM-dependent methyltransferase [Cryptosporangium phraense]|uniref:class I SAM-dependent methyltransferase n=1 Tax=Cryptosporangium phraense TaxID=2593070 RepID=UPI0014794E2C|nr:class I SAM-dependent methyltransferase [Cryptosporangium phraense]